MKRREFLGRHTAALAAAGLSTLGPPSADARAQDVAPPADADPAAVGSPVLLHPDVDRVTVAWRVHRLSIGRVEFGKTDELGQVAQTVQHGLHRRHPACLSVELTGLEPGTTYAYRTVTTALNYPDARYVNVPIREDAHRGPIRTFRTPDARADAADFAVINDTHENAPVIHGLFQKLRADPVDTVIWNGDLFNNVTSPRLVTEQTLDLLGPGGYAAQTPLVFVYGNHDVRGEHAAELDTVFPTRDGRRYFTFQQGPVRCMVLDTGEDKPDTHEYLAGLTGFEAYRGEQRDWIAREIRTDAWREAAFRVVFCHIPLFGPWHCPDGQAKWHDLLVAGGVDAMVSGHTHEHAYHPPDATRPYPVLVGGGPHPQNATLIRAHATRRQLAFSLERFDGAPVGRWTLDARA